MNSEFHVTILNSAERDFIQLIEAALTDDIEDHLVLAFEKALNTLRTNASNAGEPIYDLKQMKMRVCRLLIPPLYIEYGVHYTQPSAFIRRVVLLRQPI